MKSGATENRRSEPKRAAGARGFTLLELLVSIAIVSLLVTTALFGWRVAASAWDKASSRMEEERTVLATHLLLQEQMASMTPQQVWAEQTGREIFFQGEPQTVRFVSRYSLAHRARSGLYLIEYQVAKQSDGTSALLLNEYPVSNANQELAPQITGADMTAAGRKLRFAPLAGSSQTIRVLEGMREIRLEYFRPRLFTEPGVWVDDWPNAGDELPRAMAIRGVSRAASGADEAVSIVAAVRNFVGPAQP